MARKIKGYKFMERHKDAWEEMKAIRIYLGQYGKSNMKVLFMKNQFGVPYTDIYLKVNAKPTKAFKKYLDSRKKKKLEKVM